MTPAAESVSEGPGRFRIILRWVIDLLVCFAIAFAVLIPIGIAFRNTPRTVEREDLWRFTALPADETALSEWATSQKELQHVRMRRPPTANQLVVRYEREEQRGPRRPDWESLGYQGAYLVSSRTSMPKYMPAMLLATSILLALAALYRLRRTRGTAAQLIQFGERPQPGWWKWLLVAAAAAGAINLLQTAILELLHIDPNQPDPSLGTLWLLDGWRLTMLIFAMVLAGPVAEELLFRGLLLGRFAAHGYWRSGVAISAVLFTLAHPPRQYIEMVGASLLLAWLYRRTRSLWPPIALHILNNAASGVIALMDKTR